MLVVFFLTRFNRIARLKLKTLLVGIGCQRRFSFVVILQYDTSLARTLLARKKVAKNIDAKVRSPDEQAEDKS